MNNKSKSKNINSFINQSDSNIKHK